MGFLTSMLFWYGKIPSKMNMFFRIGGCLRFSDTIHRQSVVRDWAPAMAAKAASTKSFRVESIGRNHAICMLCTTGITLRNSLDQQEILSKMAMENPSFIEYVFPLKTSMYGGFGIAMFVCRKIFPAGSQGREV